MSSLCGNIKNIKVNDFVFLKIDIFGPENPKVLPLPTIHSEVRQQLKCYFQTNYLCNHGNEIIKLHKKV